MGEIKLIVTEEYPPFVTFEKIAVEDRAASEQMGYLMTKDVNMAYIMQRGSRDRVEKIAEEWLSQIQKQSLDGRYNSIWVEGYKKKFEMWKQGMEQEVSGSNIKNALFLTPAQINNYINGGVLTLEDLVNLSEEAIINFGFGSRSHKEEALKILNTNKSSEVLKNQLQDLREELKVIKALLDEKNNVEIVHPNKEIKEKKQAVSSLEVLPKRRGRPPKIKTSTE